MTIVYAGLGSNIGDKEKNINNALAFISELYEIKKISHLYLTEPVGNIKQDWFLNCVIEIETGVDPKKLLSSFKDIEQKLGRKKTLKNGPRIIDIDILFYGDLVVKTKNLVIPHPFIQERLFVLQPMMDLNPDFIHPVLKNSIWGLYESHPRVQKVILHK
ncbi:MAG TPA: 2-amino-4-hydroxy-6-hydroxymethyldihydropteridine diphosphokinase [Thermoplasmata archaeon]|jgi:2-amino-4-hydroxy-6-hydroxymethyldihydropteridine diphosphokinase|nr:MAG TPA: 2-amino-4-hydroxy-6-hydroxymethyldihydropteridine diphosphokinase [Thermoplasmata archaeon]